MRKALAALVAALFLLSWTHGAVTFNVASQSIDFGALTLSGAGAVAPATSGFGSITSAACSGSNYADFNAITSSGVLTPSGNASLTHGPYTLSCTFNGTISATLTVKTTGNDSCGNNLAVSWSTANITEIKTAGESGSLALGNNILLRAGQFNQAAADVRIKRGAPAPSGSFTAPSLFSASHSDQGIDPSTGNFVVVKPHCGAAPIVYRLSLDNINGGSKYFRFSGLTQYATGIVFINSATDSGWDNNSLLVDPGVTGPPTNFGPTMSAGGASTARIFAVNNTLRDVNNGIAITGPNSNIVGNDIRRNWTDACHLNGDFSNSLIAWNVATDQKNPNSGSHPDFCQLDNSALSSVVDNVRLIGNLFWRGSGTSGLVDAQGLFESGNASFLTTNLVACGNFYLGTFTRGISPTASSPLVQFNTVITDSTDSIASSPTASIIFDGSTGGSILNNIASTITPNGATASNNFITRYDGSGGALYSTYFVSPQMGAMEINPLVDYAILGGSAPATASPKAGAIGTGYFDFVNRAHSEPGAVCGGG